MALVAALRVAAEDIQVREATGSDNLVKVNTVPTLPPIPPTPTRSRWRSPVPAGQAFLLETTNTNTSAPA
jgi:hypothetical protein